MRQLLSELTAIPGGFAHEYPVMCYIRDRLQGKVDTMQIDGIGNLIVTFVKWIWKKIHKKKDETAETAEATEE